MESATSHGRLVNTPEKILVQPTAFTAEVSTNPPVVPRSIRSALSNRVPDSHDAHTGHRARTIGREGR